VTVAAVVARATRLRERRLEYQRVPTEALQVVVAMEREVENQVAWEYATP
jgi:hypothetical protein